MNRFTVIPVESNVTTISDCISLAKEIEAQLNAGNLFIAVHFHQQAFITGSLIGFIIEKVKLINEKGGRLVIIASSREQNDLMSMAQVGSFIPVFASLDELKQLEV